MTFWYRTAIACGLFPMLSGTAIFAAWLVTDSDALEIAGLFLIYGGLALFAAGIASLVVFITRARAAGIPCRGPAILVFVILFLNLPLCVTFVAVAFALETAHHVTVVNRAGVAIEALVLVDPTGQQFRIGTVGPGQTRHACPGFSGEGAVRFSFDVAGDARAGMLIGYMADPPGSHATLRLSEDLTVATGEEFDRISLSGFFRHCVPGG